jgi:hypothetical protein
MGFFCENDFNNIEGVREALQTRSQKITKRDIREAASNLYHQETRASECGRTYTVYVDNY